MSQFSGKCDVADNFFMGWDWDGSAEELKKHFEEFRDSLGGVIYETYLIDKITEHNQELVAKYERAFTFEKHEEVIKDKRYKDGERKRVYYTYKYWGVEYSSLRELNKKNKGGFYVNIPHPIETIYDLIEFFPYVPHAYGFDKTYNSSYIKVGPQSYVEEEYQELLNFGYDSQACYILYKQALQDFTKKCVELGL